MLNKIISGGQTGADQAALDAAIKLGIPHGGWIPKGRPTENGKLPDKYKLKEMPTKSYPKRTEQNVIDSDGTLIITHGKLTGGSKLTQKVAKKHNRPCLHINLNETLLFIASSKINSWIIEHGIEVLNVAGSRASKDPKIYKDAFYIVEGAVLLGLVKANAGDYLNDYQMDDIDQIIEEIISELPLGEKVSMANMDKEAVEIVQSVFDLYIKNKIGSEHEEEYTVIMKALWDRLQETHRLKVVK
jgi:Circularly permutated YpsA SLOG family